jgi:hypothetical protein
MEAFESFEHAGFTIELHTDDDPMSPGDWDQLGTMHSFDRGSELRGFGDTFGDGSEAWERERPGLTIRYLRMSKQQPAVLFQLQDYGSGGMRILALDDDEDRSATGYISTTPARIAELCGPPQIPSDPFYAPRTWPATGPSAYPNWEGSAEDWVRGQLRAQLREWDAYVSGEVVGYVVKDARGEHVDSCWGFYPDDNRDPLEYVRAEARGQAEYERDHRAKRALETRRGWAIAHGQTPREAMPV